MTRRQRLKELAEFLVRGPYTEVSSFFNTDYKNHGEARAKTYVYSISDLHISYTKWFVENYETALKMGLKGCECHDSLIGGTGVTIVSKRFGYEVFYGQGAQDIIKACEMGPDIPLDMLEKIHRIPQNTR